MPTMLNGKPTSQGQAMDGYLSWWKERGYRPNGKGLLVPYEKGAASIGNMLTTRGVESITEVKAYDPKNKLFIAGVANAKETDRYEEVVDPEGLLKEAYMKNPVLLYQHNHNEPVGLVTNLNIELIGTMFEGWCGDPAAGPLTQTQEKVRSLICQKILKAVSIGFLAHEIQTPTFNDRGDLVEPALIKRWEMLELSVVAVPANRNSLFNAKADAASKPKVEIPKKLWSFPTLGKDGKFSTRTPKEKEMDEELLKLLTAQSESLKGIATALNALIDGQKSLMSGIEGLGAKGKKPDEEDPKKPDKEDEDKKKSATDVAALSTRVDDIAESVKSLVDSIGLIAERLPKAG